MIPIAHYQPPAFSVQLTGKLFDVRADFLLNRIGQQPLGPHPEHFLERRPHLVAWLDTTNLTYTFFYGVCPFSRLMPGAAFDNQGDTLCLCLGDIYVKRMVSSFGWRIQLSGLSLADSSESIRRGYRQYVLEHGCR